MKVLLIEDDFLSCKIMQSHIREHHGIECDITRDGLKGLEAIKLSIDKKEHYDIIFLDIMMPVMYGDILLDEIKKIEKKECIKNQSKIIITTSLAADSKIIYSYLEQCDGYLTKPINSTEYKESMMKLNLIKVI